MDYITRATGAEVKAELSCQGFEQVDLAPDWEQTCDDLQRSRPVALPHEARELKQAATGLAQPVAPRISPLNSRCKAGEWRAAISP